MGISERKEREKQEMKERILNAALSMFIEEGYEGTSIRKIADAIEYSPATIYLYYKDKDELLYDVQGEAFDKLYRVFSEEAVSKSPMKRLEQICESYIRFGLTHPELYGLMFTYNSPMNVVDDLPIWTNAEAAFRFLYDTIEASVQRDLLRFTDIREAVVSIWAFAHGLISLHNSCRMKVIPFDSPEQLEQLIYKLTHQFLNFVRALP